LAQAEKIYRQILDQNPDYPEALHNLGVVACQSGDNAGAVELIDRAIALKPDYPEAYSSLGSALRAAGKNQEAIEALRRAIQLRPRFAEAHYNLGNALADVKRLDEAIASFRQAIQLKGELVQAHANLAKALEEQGNLSESMAAYRQAIALDPHVARPHYRLGILLHRTRQMEEAVASLNRALQINPSSPEVNNDLGIALRDAGQTSQALASYRQAILLRPDYAVAHNNLGNLLKDLGHLDEALAAHQQAVRFNPTFAEAHNNLGNTFKEMALLEESVAAYREAIRLRPELEMAWSNLLYAIHFHPGYDAAAIYAEHKVWNQRRAAPMGKGISPYLNDRNPDRRLRIGYVSPDFRDHPVGRFLTPLLSRHDRERFEVYCYSDVLRPDGVTELLRRQAGQWRNIVGISDERLAQGIREDRIDILVDLTMHMARNRMLLFARKPAPLQVTYLAYCSTTGLETMDYRLTDPYLDPPGSGDGYYSEKSVRLPRTYWCYPVDERAPEVGPLPVGRDGVVTFGSLNNFGKNSPEAIATWIELLQGAPKSRLVLHAYPFSHREKVWDLLKQNDIDPGRLRFIEKVPFRRYLELYGEIDIGLDPFPCGGGTTTCDALWMGVPVITLAGRTAVGRGGVSILNNVGMPELIAQTREEYVRIGVALAGDVGRLESLRRSLRERMGGSALMDGQGFARDVEGVYREMWRGWCD